MVENPTASSIACLWVPVGNRRKEGEREGRREGRRERERGGREGKEEGWWKRGRERRVRCNLICSQRGKMRLIEAT
jgi:hypothetical protein